MAEWEEALESENQRKAKLIVMEAIAAAERRGCRRGWEMACNAAADRLPVDSEWRHELRHLPYPEKE